jgi:excinuclease ABC subunit B
MAILYADKITDSMRLAMEETERRRTLQYEYNKQHGITPTTIQKDVVDMIERYIEEEPDGGISDEILDKYHPDNFKSKKEWKEKLKSDMIEAADNLDFETAAMIRDILFSAEKSKS